MNSRPRLAALFVLACFLGLMNHGIMRMNVASSKTIRFEICNNTDLAATTSNVLPTCESLMKSPNSPVADGAFLTRETTPNTWTLRTDGSRQLNLPFTCRLKRYTSSEARQCLSNKHLSFIGDSLTRYQFLSLAYFLERGQYPPRFSRSANCTHIDEEGNPTCSPNDEPNVCNEADWVSPGREDTWKDFHSALGGGTDGGIFNGRLECACARRVRYMDNITENFLYVSEEERSGGGRVTMSFVNEIGWTQDPSPIHGWNFSNCSYEGTCRMTSNESERLLARNIAEDFDFREPLLQALQNGTLRRILPAVDIALYNRGLWNLLTAERAFAIMQLLKEWSGEGRCFYKTTTGCVKTFLGFRDREISAMREPTFNVGCGFFDIAHLTKEFSWLMYRHPIPPKEEHGTISNSREWGDVFWDSIHYMPWVYEELNNMFLNVLCNSKM